jgi:hypothetical protein
MRPDETNIEDFATLVLINKIALPDMYFGKAHCRGAKHGHRRMGCLECPKTLEVVWCNVCEKKNIMDILLPKKIMNLILIIYFDSFPSNSATLNFTVEDFGITFLDRYR